MRYIVPTILGGLTMAMFFLLTQPLYNSMSEVKQTVTAYNEALSNSKSLENERDKLTKKFNSFPAEDLARLSKLLPDSVDNIRLILEIERIAAPYGMILRDVAYSTTVGSGLPSPSGGIENDSEANKVYGSFDLQFSTESNYENFLSFIGALENNLRIVDVTMLSFASATVGGATLSTPAADTYKYTFQIKTYWLKN